MNYILDSVIQLVNFPKVSSTPILALSQAQSVNILLQERIIQIDERNGIKPINKCSVDYACIVQQPDQIEIAADLIDAFSGTLIGDHLFRSHSSIPQPSGFPSRSPVLRIFQPVDNFLKNVKLLQLLRGAEVLFCHKQIEVCRNARAGCRYRGEKYSWPYWWVQAPLFLGFYRRCVLELL
jgi:hypothetical protein